MNAEKTCGSLVLFILACHLLACRGGTSHNVLIEDFETASYGDWIIEGTAFGDGPGEGRVPGSLGSRAAQSLEKPGVGSLTSPLFTVDHDAIHFLMFSFEHPVDGTAGDVGVELLVNGEVVRSRVPSRGNSRFHAMFWEAWNVSDLIGQSAQIRIFDRSSWAGVAIDHIIQSDVLPESPYLERTITVDKPTLNYPVKTGAVRQYLELIVDGKKVRSMDVALAPDDIDYWVVTDLSPWQGKEVLIRTRPHPLTDANILDRISVEEGIRDSDDLYQEPLRPQFHFSSKRGWLNDPNGLVWYDGEWHLFYQHNPYGWDHSRNDYNKTWGHAVSADLVHWEELPGVIHPDHLGPIYSGSAVVDHENTTGFQTGEEKPIVAVYTSAGGRSPWSEGLKFTQSIACSNDRGRTFTPYDNNPVLENFDYINRDPKAIWHELSGQWVIVLHFNEKAMVFFTSKDLKEWKKQSVFKSEQMADCPELFELPVDGNPDNKKWILYGGSGDYHAGSFDGKRFRAETGLIRYNYGNAFYASQTFNNAPDGRRVQMAWATIPAPDMPFNMSMLFPVELSLRSTAEGLRLFANPVKEIENIRKNTHEWENVSLQEGITPLDEVEGVLFDIEVEFTVKDADTFGLIVGGRKLSYETGEKTIEFGNQSAELRPVNGRVKIRLLIDRTSIEVFGNDGLLYMPLRTYQSDDSGIQVFSAGGSTTIANVKIHELKSIWR